MAKTNYIYNSEDYLKKRLAGEHVASAVALYGINAMAMHQVSNSFTVLVVNMKDFSVFRYDVIQNRFRVVEFEESTPHVLTDVVTPELLLNKVMLKWWNCVFFERDGLRAYDKFYDDFKIADGTDVTFKDVIKGFNSFFSKIPWSKMSKNVFLTGDLAENPLLQYLLQKQLPNKEISVLSCDNEAATYIENKMVIIPKGKLDNLKLNTNIVIDLATIVYEPISITLPLDSTMESMMLPNIRWKDLLVDDHKDYSVKDTDFKTIELHIEYDPFQNVFLYCEDMNGNQKVLQVK